MCIVCASVIATCVCNIYVDFRHSVFYMSVKPASYRNTGDPNFFLCRQVLLQKGTERLAKHFAMVSSQTSPASPQS
jgi:hypothetical protein